MDVQAGPSLAGASTLDPDVTLARSDRVVRAAHGDADAFDELIAACGDGLFRRASAILRSDVDARDAAQEALIRAWRELPKLKDVGRFEAWLDRILVNVCRDQLRSRGRRSAREAHSIDAASAADPSDADADRPAAALERREAIESAFVLLDADERSLIVLHHLDGRSVAELAERLGIPRGTVKWRLHSARKHLQQALEGERR